MKVCEKCKVEFKTHGYIDGKKKVFTTRKYCLVCSPFGIHNTRKLTDVELKSQLQHKICPRCNIDKPRSQFYNRRTRPGTITYCKLCSNKQATERQRELKIKAVEYKGGKCVFCG